MYTIPPFAVINAMPSFLAHYTNDVRGWALLQIVCVHIIVYASCVFHALTPLQWPFEKEVNANYGIPIISRVQFFENSLTPPWVYAFLLLPIFIPINIICVWIKVSAPKSKLKVLAPTVLSDAFWKVTTVACMILVTLLSSTAAVNLSRVANAYRTFNFGFVTTLVVLVSLGMFWILRSMQPILFAQFVSEKVKTMRKMFSMGEFKKKVADDVLLYDQEMPSLPAESTYEAMEAKPMTLADRVFFRA